MATWSNLEKGGQPYTYDSSERLYDQTSETGTGRAITYELIGSDTTFSNQSKS